MRQPESWTYALIRGFSLIRSYPPAHADFLKDAECDGNSMWICGTFGSDAIAKVFYDKFTKDLVGDNALAMAGVQNTDFCKLFPGVTISINSYEYQGVYDHNWGSKGMDSYTWEPVQNCPSCDVHYTYTCPLPPPPCNTCWKWTLSGCKNNYYGGLNCNKALNQFKWYLSSIGYLGEWSGSCQDRYGIRHADTSACCCQAGLATAQLPCPVLPAATTPELHLLLGSPPCLASPYRV